MHNLAEQATLRGLRFVNLHKSCNVRERLAWEVQPDRGIINSILTVFIVSATVGVLYAAKIAKLRSDEARAS